MDHMIELRRVSKFYKSRETVSAGFSRIDLSLDMGEFVAITGESGSGKSTLLNVISGLDSYEEGEMFVNGEDTSGYKTEDYEAYRKKYIGNIFQDYNLVNSYTVYQNIELTMLMNGMKKSECRDRVNELIELVGLTEYRRTKASKLSGGQKQRVAIARALAKDAPIIVADEPTGNLDSESAKIVMETLYRISPGRLVVIVTHNYDQVEPYVTRKITMSDGHIIEDKKIRPKRLTAEQAEAAAVEEDDSERKADELFSYVMGEEPAVEETSGTAESDDEEADFRMRPGEQLRLGIRNTFNLPTKFILLLIVYLFVSSSVIAQYGSTKNSLHESALMGLNEWFQYASPDRLVVTKDGGEKFTDDEIRNLEDMDNVDFVAKYDTELDEGIYLDSSDIGTSGPFLPEEAIDESDITYGGMPEKENDVVIKVNDLSNGYDAVKREGADLVGRTFYLRSDQRDDRIPVGRVRICGVILAGEEDSVGVNTGNGWFYAKDGLLKRLATEYIGTTTACTFDFGGTRLKDQTAQVEKSSRVPDGKAYISETSASTYFDNGKASGKNLKITAKAAHFTSHASLTIDRIVTDKNCEQLLGLSKSSFEEKSSSVFVSPSTYNSLFSRGVRQVSVFMSDETNSAETVSALRSEGYSVFAIKDSLADQSSSTSYIVKMFSVAMLIVEFIVLFFIAYAVIRLIMRSRNTYYSTLRILGASRKNTDSILRIELVFMMMIACAVDAVFIVLTKTGRVNVFNFAEKLAFVEPVDYVILFAALLGMSLLIAKRYSRKIFSSTAMNIYREEA